MLTEIRVCMCAELEPGAKSNSSAGIYSALTAKSVSKQHTHAHANRQREG